MSLVCCLEYIHEVSIVEPLEFGGLYSIIVENILDQRCLSVRFGEAHQAFREVFCNVLGLGGVADNLVTIIPGMQLRYQWKIQRDIVALLFGTIVYTTP